MSNTETVKKMGFVRLPDAPVQPDANHPAWNAYWALCHSVIRDTPDPEHHKYKTHTIGERDGRYWGDVEFTYGETANVPPSVVAPCAELEQSAEDAADAMLAAGELSDPAAAAPTEPMEFTNAPVTIVPPGEALPVTKMKKLRAKKQPIPTGPVRPDNIPVSAFAHVLPGGNIIWTFSDGQKQQCAVRPDFVNQDLSLIGWGGSPDDAVHDLFKQERDMEERMNQPLTPEKEESVAKIVQAAIDAEEVKDATIATTSDHAERKHHKYSMSKLNYIDACCGFESTEGTNEAAEEGTALHEVVEAVLSAWLEYNSTEAQSITLVQALNLALDNGMTMPNGKMMEDGQVAAVRDVLAEIDYQIPGAVEIYIEEKLPLVHPDGTELNYGHIDLVIGFADGKCTVMDYKFGKGQVREASRNYQGFGYAISFLQAHLEYSSANIIFVQPRISFKSEHRIYRHDIPGLYYKIRRLIEDAENPVKRLQAGDQCRYCELNGTCTELANYIGRVGASYENLPMPVTFHGTTITEPAEMARALFWVKRAEAAIDGIKKAATEMAKQGFELTADLGPAGRVSFELGERAVKRTLGAAPLIYKSIKHFISPEQFTACVDVKIGDLETVVSQELQSQAALRGEKLTLKAGKEQLNDILLSEGLVTRDGEKTFFLKEKQEKPVLTVQ